MPGLPRVALHTFGCKANQYDSERIRQALEDAGWAVVATPGEADAVVLNTCTVTRRADAQARGWTRRLLREAPERPVVVAGCSAVLQAPEFEALVGRQRVVRGHDPAAVVDALRATGPAPPAGDEPGAPQLVQIDPLRVRKAGTRGWLKVQDGCDRKCSFCATRLARGASRSRTPAAILEEAALLARWHPELVITGIHIGHYGLDLDPAAKAGAEVGASRRPGPVTLASLLRELLDALPEVRFRLGSVEATEVDDALLSLLATAGGRVAPHLHMPLQSGADPVLRAMRRWHTREDYRRRTLEIAEALAARGASSGSPVLGLGADIITGFPGETDADHRDTVRLVEELPFTYLHVFPFSPREGTPAAQLARERPVPQRVAAERARELRELGQARGEAYLASRVGGQVEVVVEREQADGRALGLTEDYLRLPVEGREGRDRGREGRRTGRHLQRGWLKRGTDGAVKVELAGQAAGPDPGPAPDLAPDPGPAAESGHPPRAPRSLDSARVFG